MKVDFIRTFTLSLAVFATALTFSRSHAQQAGISVGSTAPDAVVETLDGRSIRMSSLIAGKPAILEFWATWCPLCKQLEPAMKRALMKHGNSLVFVSVGVPQSQTPEKQQAYVSEHKLGGRFVFDRNEDAVKAFKVPHTSFIVVVDATGKVVYTGVGPDQDIEAAIGQLHSGMGAH
jgi:thiol-disulfide isomerase/thioredoxin